MAGKPNFLLTTRKKLDEDLLVRGMPLGKLQLNIDVMLRDDIDFCEAGDSIGGNDFHTERVIGVRTIVFM